MTQTTVLITGCSDGSLGSSLALELHARKEYRVFATARNESKLGNVKAAGIETIELDVLSPESIQNAAVAVRKLTGGSLDILVNNAGAQYISSVAEGSIEQGKKLFDINVWSVMGTTQGFLPLLLRSTRGGIIVNHTSILSLVSPPFIGFYSASKAAAATLTAAMRSELSPFGIRVVELKSGTTKSNLSSSQPQHEPVSQKSLYWPAREQVDRLLTAQGFDEGALPSAEWARKVADAIIRKNPADTLYYGAGAKFMWLATSLLPSSIVRVLVESWTKFNGVKKSIEEYGAQKVVDNATSA